MKYLLIPVAEKRTMARSNDNTDLLVPGLILHFIMAFAFSVVLTKRFVPQMQGWEHFFVCAIAIVAYLILSIMPKIGPVLCVANGLLWIVLCWRMTEDISLPWFMWLVRIITVLLILIFESGLIIKNVE